MTNDSQPPGQAREETPGPDTGSWLTWLEPRQLRFFRAGAVLRMTIEGFCSHRAVGIFRAFPLAHPGRFYSVRDASGKEIGLIADPSKLGPEDRRLVEADLERRYVVAPIRRILRVTERAGTSIWEVETSRGPCRFGLRDLRNHVLRPQPGRYLLTDVEGRRYEIADIAALDPRSRALLRRLI